MFIDRFHQETARQISREKEAVYTLTISIPTALPSNLIVDTSVLGVTPSVKYPSSSYAMQTALPVLFLIAAPAAILLPQING
jgi:hypothetical protein